MYSNIFYFKKISKIGGTEVYLWEIAKKYNIYDITILYDEGDKFQLDRLKKLVRCKRRIPGKKIECKRAFFNFNIDAINDIISTENYYAFVSHANWEELGYKPPINHPKLNHFIAVSQFATYKLNEYAKKLGMNINAEKCYNPLKLEPKEKVMIFVSAARLDDEVKGGHRIQKMIEAADRYCEKTGRHYLWLIFSNPSIKATICSNNVAIMPPRIDVRPYIAMADWIIHLPNNMETYCYTDNEALGYGVPIVTTPLSILNELPITDNEHLVVDYECTNVDEIVEKIFTKQVKPFDYNPPKDNWLDFIDKTKSNYEEEKMMKVKVKATNKYKAGNTSDNELSEIEKKRVVPEQGREWITTKERADMLEENGYVTIIEALKEEVIETATKKTTTEKAVKKTTTKKTTTKKDK